MIGTAVTYQNTPLHSITYRYIPLQAFGSTIGTADLIPRQLVIVSRERASKM